MARVIRDSNGTPMALNEWTDEEVFEELHNMIAARIMMHPINGMELDDDIETLRAEYLERINQC